MGGVAGTFCAVDPAVGVREAGKAPAVSTPEPVVAWPRGGGEGGLGGRGGPGHAVEAAGGSIGTRGLAETGRETSVPVWAAPRAQADTDPKAPFGQKPRLLVTSAGVCGGG